jgi:16S rRNA (cytidine1402-2'-O)-methyltransferase
MPDQETSSDAGILSVVGTPIGNLEDITLRALRVLGEAALIAAEDTRRTRKLLAHYDIHTPLVSYHEHNKRARTPKLVRELKAGKHIALVSDAGMPGISDPGADLIVAALQERIEVKVVPGPSAIVSALVLSGFRTDAFAFAGFVPRKAGERTRFIDRVLQSEATSVLFESPTRLVALLEKIARHAPERPIAVARELTKKFEQVVRGTASEVAAHFHEQTPRGEFVITIEGASAPAEHDIEDSAEDIGTFVEALMRDKGMPKKEALRAAAKKFNISRRTVYKTLLEAKPDESPHDA